MWHDLPREGLPSHGSSLVKQGVGGLSSEANGKLPFPLSFFPHLVCSFLGLERDAGASEKAVLALATADLG